VAVLHRAVRFDEATAGVGQSAHGRNRQDQALLDSVPGERKGSSVRDLGGRDPVHRLPVTLRFGSRERRARSGSAVFSGRRALIAWAALALSLGCARPVPEAATPSPGASAALVAPPPAGNNLLKESTFEQGKSVPRTTSFTAPARGS